MNQSTSRWRLLLLCLLAVPVAGEAAVKYWIGSAGGTFGTNTNWSTTSGSACGVNANTTAPGSSDIATFTSSCINNAVLSGSPVVNVAGINITTYTGTITQSSGATVTVGASNYNQTSGTFSGGNAAITLNGTFTLGGGTFTSTSGTLTSAANWTVSAGTLNPNSGTVQFKSTSSQSLTGSQTLNNVTIGGNYGETLTIAGGTTLTVNGTLTFATANLVTTNGGAIVANGDINQGAAGANGTTLVTVSGSAAQALTGGGAAASLLPLTINKASGTLTLVGTVSVTNNWTYTAGTLNAGTSTVQFKSTSSQSLTGSQTLNNVTIGGNYGETLTIAGGTTLTVNGTLTFATTAYLVTTNGGAIVANGDINQGAAGANGTTPVTISGSVAQTLTGGGSAANLLPLTINKASGTLTLVGTVSVTNNWTYTAGTLNAGTSTVQFKSTSSQSLTGSQTLNNVTIGGNYGETLTIAGGTTLTVNGTLTFATTAYLVTTNGGAIVANGDINQGAAGANGTTPVTISGSVAQTLTGGGSAANLLPLTINKASGTLTLVGTVSVTNNWTYTAGTLNAGTSTVQFKSTGSQSLTGSQTLNNVTIGGNYGETLTIAGGTTLTVNGTLTFATAYLVTTNGGAIVANGDINQGTAGANGTTPVTISGSVAQTLTGGGSAANLLPLTINKASGILTLAGIITTDNSWTYTAGTLDAGTSTLQFFTGANRTSTLTGSQTLNNLTIGVGSSYGNILTIAGGTAVTVNGTLNLGATYLVAVNGGSIAAKGDIVQSATGANGSTLVTISGTGAQTWTSGGGPIPGTVVTVNKPSGVVTLGSSVSLATTQALTISAGTLDQGASYNLQSGTVTVGASGVWSNTGTGSVTLGGNVSNSGSITLSGGGPGCGNGVILIRSSTSGTQRAWAGGGTFTIEDVDVQDQGGTATISAYSSTKQTDMGANWTFNSSCSSVPAAGGFNAYETSTAAGAISGVIKTRIAGASVSLDLIVLNAGKTAIQTSFTGTVRVEVLDSSNNSAALDANNCRSSWVSLQTLSPDPVLVAGDNGRKTVSFTQANSYPDARLRITYPVGAPTQTGCSNDDFAIRPNALTLSVTDGAWASAGSARALANGVATGGIVHKAGQPFSVGASAVNSGGATTTNYSGTALASVSACAGSACTSSLGTLTLSAPATAGVISQSATYSEAGSFALQLTDSTFASVDASDGSTLAERTIASPIVTVGRFVPDHFDLVLLAAPTFKTFGTTSCAARSFTYVGQPFGYASVPQATLLARNSGGATTANYSGALWKLGSSSVAQAYAATPATPVLDASGATVPALTSNSNGSGLLVAAATDQINFTRPANAPLAPFNANLALTWSVQDANEVAVSGNGTIVTTTPLTFSSIAFDAGNPFRFGMLRLTPAYGSELVDLPVLAEAQYWDGQRMTTNAADQCTALPTSTVAMGNYQGSLAACKTAIAAGTATLASGRTWLKLARPGSGNSGSLDLTLQLGAAASGQTCSTVGAAASATNAANLAWLQGKWNGSAAFDQNPATRASFGQYRSPLIYMRESY